MIPVPQRSERIRRERRSFYLSWVLVCLLAVLLGVLIRLFLYEPFTAPDASMERQIVTNDLLLVNKWIYHLRQPKRGEIVVVFTSQGFKTSRIIGLPHEMIAAKQNRIWIDHKPLSEPYVDKQIHTVDVSPQKISPGSYYVLGDSREESYDSRYFGPVSQRQILGRVEGVYWPLSHLQLLW
jgi:signal peptidase I